MFDPAQPATGSPLDSAVMRSQLTSLKALIDAVPAGPPGPQGVPGIQGPPFAQAIVDAVNTLKPGESATVTVSFDGTNVHFTYGIPRGAEGVQGPPGEVTAAQLTAAIATTAQNPAAVSPLNQVADAAYNQGQLQQVMDKLDELLAAVKRL